MEGLLNFITAVCGRIQVISDLFWDFPTNFEGYANIPVLGNFSLAVILLIGSGIYFTVRLRFIQVRRFSYGIRILKNSRAKDSKTGISPLAAFFLSTAMRVGPGNILGVTGAVSVGGPGALLWMWISAFFGMATAFVESTLSQ
ncbi:MAG TPA: sodium:alanine symporter, partial [Lachnospiraceae bacterium]|nr:sodium:alanine symporter [Lachnospiraceae bacterium]